MVNIAFSPSPILFHGRRSRGNAGDKSPEFGVGTLMQIVPLRFLSYRYKNSVLCVGLGYKQELIGREIANVNFLCNDVVHALKIQQTLA